MTKQSHKCDECGASYEVRKAGQRFCATPCAKKFNNRRMVRGAQLLDVMMTEYTERQHPSRKNGTFTTVKNRLLSRWRDEDRRAGRAHCGDPMPMIRNDMTLSAAYEYASRNPWG